MMPFKVFLILSALLCSLIIQPSMAARDLAHDTQTKVVVQKPYISYPAVRPILPCRPPYCRRSPPPPTPPPPTPPPPTP